MFAGPPRSDICQRSLDIAQTTNTELGVPIADQKTEGPSTVISFLGILIDTLKGELTLPEKTLVSRTVYVNKMSPYSNSNYLSSTVSIV